ncbi:hypothetical protein [Shewanella kaireitica]|uniref:hypothetical protein n=1 Tax=Shewanella kaireitica TaxID=212021 RepID=UPI00200FF977|nr:hypothetical protein [Shewanella kaireitica]MCL1094670.1 hypothetical protein [Shewanella kaireitica]
MNKNNLIAAMTSLLVIFSTSALAHPGHDHSAESSNLIHLLWAAPVVVAAVLAYKLLRSALVKRSSLDGNK